MLYGMTEERLADARVRSETDGGILLVTAEGRIRACRAPALRCKLGGAISSALGIPAEEKAALEQYLSSAAADALLLQCEKTPIVAWGGSVVGGDTLLLVPPAGIRAALRSPLLYFERPARHLRLSVQSTRAQAPFKEELARPLYSWLSEVQELFAPMTQAGEIGEVTRLIERRVMRLARLCGVTADIDLGGLGLFSLPEADPNALTLQMAALMLLAHRAAEDESLTMFVDREGPDAPVMHAILRLREAGDPLSELEGLAEAAKLRGNLFAASPVPEEPTLLYVRFTFTRKELSLQEMRSFLNFDIGRQDTPT